MKNNTKLYSAVMHMYDGCFYKYVAEFLESKTNVKYILCTYVQYSDMGSIFKPIQPRDIDRGYSCKFNCKGAPTMYMQ